MNDRTLAVAACAIVLLLPACTVGPRYRPPLVATPVEWTSLRIDGSESRPGVTSRPDSRSAEVATWWMHFGDATLTSLVERAARSNLTLAQARARVCQARAARAAVAGTLSPQVSGNASAIRGGVGNSEASAFRAGFDASWEIDVFGGLRREIEAACADVRAVEADRDATMVSVAGEVGAIYLDVRGRQRQLAIARKNVAAQQQTLDLTKERFEAGFVSALDVANARGQVAATSSSIPSLESQVSSSIYALGVLLGEEPGALVQELAAPATDAVPPAPLIPADIPIGIPSELLQRRPDIVRAEAQLHAATARVGVAVANQYPRFNLAGGFGTAGVSAGSLIDFANRTWSIGPSMTVPLLTGGITQANIAQARAIACAAFLAYKASVLIALQDVETALVNFTHEQERREFLAESVAANAQAVDLSIQQYSAGKTDFLNVLSAQRQLVLTEASLAQSETAVATNLVALYKALGGGW